MNILKELKKAWDNAVLTKSEKQAASADSLEQLKREIESASGTSVEKPVLPDAPTYEKIDYTAKTDEQLEQNAANAYKEYERKALENIEQSINAEREDLNKNKTDAQNAKDAKLEKIDELYDTAKKSLNDDVLKRGLARSSIAVAQSAGLERAEPTARRKPKTHSKKRRRKSPAAYSDSTKRNAAKRQSWIKSWRIRWRQSWKNSKTRSAKLRWTH